MSHTVQEGETVEGISEEYFGTRKLGLQITSYNGLAEDYQPQPGDVLAIPGKIWKAKSLSKDQDEPVLQMVAWLLANLHVRLLDTLGDPVTGASCRAEFSDGTTSHGTTDDRGWLRLTCQGRPAHVDLHLEDSPDEEPRRVYLGSDEETDDERAKRSLWNLGFRGEDEEAPLSFQRLHGMEQTGEIDDALKARLEDLYSDHKNQDALSEGDDSVLEVEVESENGDEGRT